MYIIILHSWCDVDTKQIFVFIMNRKQMKGHYNIIIMVGQG